MEDGGAIMVRQDIVQGRARTQGRRIPGATEALGMQVTTLGLGGEVVVPIEEACRTMGGGMVNFGTVVVASIQRGTDG